MLTSFTIRITTPIMRAINSSAPTAMMTSTHQGNGRPPFLPPLEEPADVDGVVFSGEVVAMGWPVGVPAWLPVAPVDDAAAVAASEALVERAKMNNDLGTH